ncbi:MAG: hypothetical protein L3J66_01310 [Bacteroidales bacterium]|nr:hypothetical protein [Bacteroidales bacterium]
MKNKFVLLQVFLLVFIMNIVNAQPCTNCQGTQDNNDNSSAIGVGTKAFGTASFASGLYSEATNIGTTAIGFRNTSIGNYSTTLGNFLKASEAHSIVIGDGYDVGFELVNNKPYSLMIGFESTKPTFFISTS